MTTKSDSRVFLVFKTRTSEKNKEAVRTMVDGIGFQQGLSFFCTFFLASSFYQEAIGRVLHGRSQKQMGIGRYKRYYVAPKEYAGYQI